MSFFSKLFKYDKNGSTINTPLDLIVSTAGLVSDPDEIDPALDDVREITSKLDTNQPPTDSENATLLKIYLIIEDYLIHKEKIRIFTRQELRDRLSQSLQQQLSSLEKAAK